MKLRNKTAVVTGAGRGLGRAIAEAMADQGASVILVSRSEDQLQEVAEAINNSGGRAEVFPADISSRHQVARLAGFIQDRFPAIDILVNNAGVIGPANIDGADADQDWETTIGVNLTGAYYCTRAAVDSMHRKKTETGGKIINIVSGLGQMPFPRFCAYAAAKAGLIQMTRSLSMELAPDGIQVNAIDPGVMDTAMQETIRSYGEKRLGHGVHSQFVRFREQGQLKPPETLAPLALFLASPASDRVTGKVGTLSDYEKMNVGFSPS